jgi:hypothetical protein
MHDVFGMGVVLGEDECLRHEGAVGKKLGKHGVPVGAQDGADLVRHHHRTVEICGRVI